MNALRFVGKALLVVVALAVAMFLSAMAQAALEPLDAGLF